MSRSLKVSPQYIEQVKSALKRNGFARQIDLARHLQLSRSTVWGFLNGRPVDYLNFFEICQKLGLDLQEIAEFDFQGSKNSFPVLDVESFEASDDIFQEQAEASNYVERPPIE